MKSKLLPALFVGLFTFLQSISPVAWSGGNQWMSVEGPEGGSISALAIDPSNPTILYAGTNAGVFKSTNGGGSWSPASTGLTLKDTSISPLVIDPSNPATLYAETGDGVFKSTNGGGSWSPANIGLTNTSVNALVVDPFNPAILYVGAGGGVIESIHGGVFKSTNGGESWSQASNGLTVTYVPVLVIDPFNPATLYAGTNEGVFKSTDGGGSWRPVSNVLRAKRVTSLAIDPSKPATLYAGTLDGGVYKSTDGGESWRLASNGLTDYVVTLAIDPYNPATLYAGTTLPSGLFKSASGGESWNPANTNGLIDTDVRILAIDPSNPATLYALTGFGLFKFTSATECLFNWAEIDYPTLFAPTGSPSAVWSNYTYRYYSATNAYLGVSSIDNHVYYQRPDGNLQDEGPLYDWLPKASCPVPTQLPIECLFNWAERSYPAPFAPSGSPTMIWGVYTYRHYEATNAYLGFSSADNHIHYMGPDGNLQDEGPLSYWLHLASCQ